ncbi:FadR/GntR family transcriptional regulator [Martelella radicis]|uniref:DNA-binding FadR family transcriptional regulator n=1 Tax=Martelella radicis TaxID=1397476 RepID=A0A7W6KNW0_9HYPH|nr:FadR/GntR family transcriptional regulator [Martelella radicis]MBB4124605.1 DNA-binding FadR family transcriptional regulator [Martelella radicis]
MAVKAKDLTGGKATTLAMKVGQAIRELIQSGQFQPGDRLPTEARLADKFGVSRTVVREAIASLRTDGLVNPRRGSGVFVLEPNDTPLLPFQNIELERISSLIEVLELRTAIEAEAVRLAAMRRSPSAEEEIVDHHRAIGRLITEGKSTIEADFALHLAITKAANNPRFVQFLELFGPTAIPRAALVREGEDQTPASYLHQIHEEHRHIVEAISNGDPEMAYKAMREHLLGSQRRYRSLLHRD